MKKKTVNYGSALKKLASEIVLMKEARERCIMIKIMAPTVATVFGLSVSSVIEDLNQAQLKTPTLDEPVGESAWKVSIDLGVKYVDDYSKF